MGIGPQLPPHLEHLSRRSTSPDPTSSSNHAAPAGAAADKSHKRQVEQDDDEEDAYGPAIPAHIRSARAAGPERPSPKQYDHNSGGSRRMIGSRSPSPIRISKPSAAGPSGRAGAIGPARPPSSTSKDTNSGAYGPARPSDSIGHARPTFDSPSPPRLARPLGPSTGGSGPAEDDSDDEIGPSLDMLSAPAQGSTKSAAQEFREREERIARAREGKAADDAEGPKRQEWMLVPPDSGVLAHVDPLRKRPTTFSRSTVDPSASGGADRSWTETPAEKRQRIADEMAGIQRPDPAQAKKQQAGAGDFGTKRRRDEEIRQEVERYSKQSRGESLLDKHQASKAAKKDKEEPPAIWDHARDMGVTGRLLNNDERAAKIRDAKGLNDRFGHSSSGAYQI